MKVKNLADSELFAAIALPQGDREIDGVYACDLLSWVMGKANEGDAWITIMSNINTIAVAALKDTACIILAEDVVLEPEILKTAQEKCINVLLSSLSAYEISKILISKGIE